MEQILQVWGKFNLSSIWNKPIVQFHHPSQSSVRKLSPTRAISILQWNVSGLFSSVSAAGGQMTGAQPPLANHRQTLLDKTISWRTVWVGQVGNTSKTKHGVSVRDTSELFPLQGRSSRNHMSHLPICGARSETICTPDDNDLLVAKMLTHPAINGIINNSRAPAINSLTSPPGEWRDQVQTIKTSHLQPTISDYNPFSAP